MRTSVVTAKVETPALLAETESSVSPTTPQNAHSSVPAEGDQSRLGYRRVAGGKHRDGTTMYICRVSGLTPGKLYNNRATTGCWTRVRYTVQVEVLQPMSNMSGDHSTNWCALKSRKVLRAGRFKRQDTPVPSAHE